ncbi:MAG: PrsW family glutamic-type intramembrane protease [Anaerolineae bacterium]
MRDSRTRLITPEEEAAPYPYLRVWRSLMLQLVLLGVFAGGIYVIFGVVSVSLPSLVVPVVSLALAFAPLGLWLIFSWWAERRVAEPRTSLMLVVILAALAANGVTIPVIEQLLQPQSWLSQSSAITRIVGYTLSVGIAIEITKYIVIRYSVWPSHIRVRIDGIVYAIAASIGMATVENLHNLAIPGITLPSLAILVLDTTVTGIAAGLFVGYGLSESALGRPTPFLGPFSVALAALVHGAAIPLRTGLGNAGFTLSGGSAHPILGIGISVGLVLVVSILVSFLFGASERREREAAAVET